MFGREKIELKTPDQVLLMRRAGLVVADALAAARAAAYAGVEKIALPGSHHRSDIARAAAEG